MYQYRRKATRRIRLYIRLQMIGQDIYTECVDEDQGSYWLKGWWIWCSNPPLEKELIQLLDSLFGTTL